MYICEFTEFQKCIKSYFKNTQRDLVGRKEFNKQQQKGRAAEDLSIPGQAPDTVWSNTTAYNCNASPPFFLVSNKYLLYYALGSGRNWQHTSKVLPTILEDQTSIPLHYSFLYMTFFFFVTWHQQYTVLSQQSTTAESALGKLPSTVPYQTKQYRRNHFKLTITQRKGTTKIARFARLHSNKSAPVPHNSFHSSAHHRRTDTFQFCPY
jgi:hypothetical protein